MPDKPITTMSDRINATKMQPVDTTTPQMFTGVGATVTSSAGDTGLRIPPKAPPKK